MTSKKTFGFPIMFACLVPADAAAATLDCVNKLAFVPTNSSDCLLAKPTTEENTNRWKPILDV